MQFRQFGKLSWKVSALGFGAMRLPTIGEGESLFNPNIDGPTAIKMIRHSIDEGVNYVDTAYPYHGGRSEVLVGQSLKDGYREKVKLATKMPSWLVKSYEDFDRYLNEQRKRLQTDHIDFYLLHGMNKKLWPRLRDLDALAWAENKIKEGLISYLGFSFHDDFDTFKEIVDAYSGWTFCQIQYNIMDIEYQAGTKGLNYAFDKGLAVVIMEPLRGGQLTREFPPSVKKLWKGSSSKRSPADLALQWIWNQPGVSVVLSGMSSMDQVIENIASAERSGVASLDENDLALIDEVREIYRELSPIPCTNCGYCMPCPNSVNIPHAFTCYNDSIIYNDLQTPRFLYFGQPQEKWANNCIECLECEEKCPQNISISEWLKKAHESFDKRNNTK
ncbi:MAG: aldo/keto reductase [Thermodesulfobacteriota bacterium]|nr:aldo/keto reductase [Thermodesulfobacteriota bacterium]